ncbi:hypothetical protein [Lapidilactobacillus gannanensis]|nr:hypothetical protein [Lapidilactobacillus gannanensis]
MAFFIEKVSDLSFIQLFLEDDVVLIFFYLLMTKFIDELELA